MGGDSYDDAAIFEALGERFGSDIYFVTHSWMGSLKITRRPCLVAGAPAG
jgi:hypothetical protein